MKAEEKLIGYGPSISMVIFSQLPTSVVEKWGEDISCGVTLGLKETAAAIAEAWEADKNDALEAQDACWHDIVDEHLANIANLQAQVAELCETIELCDRFVRSLEEARSDLVDVWPIRKVLDKALTAAPKAKRVLWEGKGEVRWYHNPPDEPHTLIEYEHILDSAYRECISVGKILEDGQLVTVTVTEAEEEG